MSDFTQAKIITRHQTANEWVVSNPVLLNGEIGIESDTSYAKLGNGVTAWNELHYIQTPTDQSLSTLYMPADSYVTGSRLAILENRLARLEAGLAGCSLILTTFTVTPNSYALDESAPTSVVLNWHIDNYEHLTSLTLVLSNGTEIHYPTDFPFSANGTYTYTDNNAIMPLKWTLIAHDEYSSVTRSVRVMAVQANSQVAYGYAPSFEQWVPTWYNFELEQNMQLTIPTQNYIFYMRPIALGALTQIRDQYFGNMPIDVFEYVGIQTVNNITYYLYKSIYSGMGPIFWSLI